MTAFKTDMDNIEIEYEIISCEYSQQGISKVQERLDANNIKINELNTEIDRLTNHADGWDYAVAVGSGVLAGIVDSLWVGEFNLERGRDWGAEKINDRVMKTAKKHGFDPDKYKGEDKLKGAIEQLEKKFHLPGDGGKVKDAFGGGYGHHLRDFRHHPTPVGWFFSMATQHTQKAYGTDVHGMFLVIDIEEKDKFLIGKDIKEKFFFGTIDWALHIISDMAGSGSNPGAGTGLPGPLGSLMKEISALPFFKELTKDGHKKFSVWISKLFNGTLLAKHDENGKIIKGTEIRFDLRAELGVAYELGRQAMPVILNECIVRGFYFIRRLFGEIKEKGIKSIRELNKIEWKKTLPFKNRSIIRMLTISTSTFMAIDLADAAIRAAAKSGGNAAAFGAAFLLRVNFVGAGRCVVAIGTDVSMGVKKEKLRNERMAIMSEQLYLANAKVFYKQGEMWIETENAVEMLKEVQEIMKQSVRFFAESVNAISNDLESIGENISRAEEKNPGLTAEMLDVLKGG